ncbi:hypothetical protein GGR55DRAFT_428355 [Xylaria sp. FL0064]|nr:hypothetical protein GGR55DRAFT_428355 [Xylaria sp. FL0064]
MVYVRPKKGTPRGPTKHPGGCRKRCDLRVPPAHQPKIIYKRHSRGERLGILLWMINNRVATSQTRVTGEPFIATKVREGLVPLKDEDYIALRKAFLKNGVIYRPPTYADAARFFNTPLHNIAHAWMKRKSYLSPEDYERSNKLPAYETAPGAGNSTPATRLNVISETIGCTDDAEVAGADNDEGDASGLPSPTVIEISDGSDIESDDDDDEKLPDLDASLSKQLVSGAQQTREQSPKGAQLRQDTPECQESGGLEVDSSDEDADGEHIEEADMYGTE